MRQGKIMVLNDFAELFFEPFEVEQVADAQATACNFVFVSWTNTTAGGADGFITTCFFTRLVERNVVRQN